MYTTTSIRERGKITLFSNTVNIGVNNKLTKQKKIMEETIKINNTQSKNHMP
jgi:hypothetical protein